MIREDGVLDRARATLMAARDVLPSGDEVARLERTVAPARSRGYFEPGEEASIRELFTRYLHVRAALHDTIHTLRPLVPRLRRIDDEVAVKAFVCAWLSGCILMRAARYLTARYADDPLVRSLLNQADPRSGTPADTFDRIRLSSCSPHTLLRYFRAMRYAEHLDSRIRKVAASPDWTPLVEALEAETPFLETQKRAHAAVYARTRADHLRQRPRRHYHRAMFGLFEASGRAIAEMRNPFHRKRIRRGTRVRAAGLLRAGDILVTRHDDAMSNLFLPGFWPHSAFVIGTEQERRDLGIAPGEVPRDPVRVVEAKKDGVRFRALRETLSIDAFFVARPRYSSDTERRNAVQRAMDQEGLLYDFEFDFTRSDRVVCTEIAYRALEGHDRMHFDLVEVSGRYTLPAEELVKQGMDRGLLDIVLVAGVRGNPVVTGSRARELLSRTLNLTPPARSRASD